MLRLLVIASMVTAAAALHCYECESESNDEEPLCDTDYWGNTTSSERDKMLTECPEYKSAFCVKLVIVVNNYTLTKRGCGAATGEDGKILSEGCKVENVLPIVQMMNMTTCLCSTRACNATESLQSVLAYVVILATVSRMLN